MQSPFKNRKSLSSILAGFNKTLNQLQELIVGNTSDIVKNGEQIAEIEARTEVLKQETASAIKVQDNLKALIGQK